MLFYSERACEAFLTVDTALHNSIFISGSRDYFSQRGIEVSRRMWFKMPSAWMRQGGLRALKWANDDLGTGSGKIAALQLYVVIAMTLDTVEIDMADEGMSTQHVSSVTFNRFRTITGLSRASICNGLAVLEALGIVNILRVGKKSYYEVVGYDGLGGGLVKSTREKNFRGMW
ncbi:hypothetical protein ACH32H_18025 [Escherichia coli]|uniref:hypothetical protein n=1 Tax=Escherichia coli TaxID=562 RepID=UPI00378D9E8F